MGHKVTAPKAIVQSFSAMKRYYTIIGTLGWGAGELFFFLLCGGFYVCLFLIAESRAFRIVFFIQLHF